MLYNFQRIIIAFYLLLAPPLVLTANEVVVPRVKLRVLIWEGHAPKNWKENLEKKISKKYNINFSVEEVYATADPRDWFDHIRSHSVDIVMMTHNFYKDQRYDFIRKKVIIPIDTSLIPNSKFLIPSLKSPSYLLDENKNLYGIPVSRGPYGLAYDSSKFKKEPESWNELWKKKHIGKYAIGENQIIYNALITGLAIGYKKEDLVDYDKINNDEFKKKLSELVGNLGSYWTGVDKAEDLLGKNLATSWEIL